MNRSAEPFHTEQEYYKELLGKPAKKAYRFGEPIGQLEVEQR